ncbi:cell division control protein Cdc6 [Haloferax sp. Atlit-10N]|uniref:ORC1-type DNA replication protein n=1 Tax=Haloferax prahovense (strain DSM 18310 / JCM 13924 / TL6) TaxID=1227461 RepID=M0GQ54_HALPT|nr:MULTISPECIES: ORC1-type DNA replication protein [Haloferax]ELZ73708.1 Orc1-type DNA replication protein [Haloferax prahovense DSM 18310]RDZ42709.1 cell division control protein Cdc6 [Haloferax sp. Atlit-19N]RDZ43295.1 cell division control protein Cdc6 [Haloferax sp. Atlit-16N]RDZ57869.1 cell division control protein Cdc6 [Haloferax sp. Atlit-10N]
MDEEENPRGGARGEVGNSTSDDSAVDGDSGDAPSTDASADDASSGAPTSAAEDDVSPEDIDIQASIGPDADAPDEDLDQHKDPDVGLDKVVLNDDEGSKGLFDDLLAGEPIFENKEVLRPSYTPHELPHRTDQINQMATILVSALRGETPSNILIYGKTGTGKTASAKFVSQELESTSQKYDVPCEVEYINCEVTDTQYRVLAQLANKFIEKNVERIEAEQERLDEMRTRATEDPNALADTPYDSIAEIDERAAELDDDADEMETVPMTGWPTDRVYTTFFDAVDYKERVVVIMLDEIDKLVEKSGDDTLYNLSRMNSELDNSRISIMGISNDLKFTDFLDPRVKSSLGEEEIVFPPYDANQLRDILQHRADVAFKPGALTDDVIPLCAAFAAQEHGDARRALDLLRTAGELAERGQADTVEEAHVRQAQDKIELDRVVEVVRTLPTQSKIVLFAIILLEKNGVRNINTGEVFNIYKRLCEEIDADVLTQRRVTDLISELDMLGIVNAVVVSKGRYGRTKEISLSVPIDETEAVLLTDSRLGDIESAQPFVQARFDN